MGITRLANVTALDYVGIPVVMVCRPNSRSLATVQGKGLGLAAAKASGLMEAVETYHAERITNALRLASYEELARTRRLADLRGLPRQRKSRFAFGLPIPWIEAYDLLSDCFTWLPYELVHADYTVPLPVGSGCFLATTNGLASGNTMLEAISHGIFEVVERDALALASVNGLPPDPAIAARLDLGSVDDGPCCELLEKYRCAGIFVTVWDITTDVGIPCFLCRIAETPGALRPLCKPTEGAGCHATREVALFRALSEAAQSRLTIIAGSREDVSEGHYQSPAAPRLAQSGPSHPSRNHRERNFSHVPSYHAETFFEDVQWALARLRSIGVEEVLVVDLASSEFNIPVVRVVVPGLEGMSFSPAYHPGPRATARRRALSCA
jgi:ribosomal protein S12 methylthiotransferase accessory factor